MLKVTGLKFGLILKSKISFGEWGEFVSEGSYCFPQNLNVLNKSIPPMSSGKIVHHSGHANKDLDWSKYVFAATRWGYQSQTIWHLSRQRIQQCVFNITRDERKRDKIQLQHGEGRKGS